MQVAHSPADAVQALLDPGGDRPIVVGIRDEGVVGERLPLSPSLLFPNLRSLSTHGHLPDLQAISIRMDGIL
ncbi:hypothetical protein [Rhodococcus sp. NPDC058514]|uniref:hypothetical protein n=1 Tax=unclassified Rhodococcus (in: high G+C Gram-positive bacteria) TaxID=192944 RepID=UPI003667F86C